MKESILLELKKYDLKNLYKITFGFAFIPFVLLCVFILIKNKQLIEEEISLYYFSIQSLLFWTAFLYPFFIVLITQMLIDIEKKSNSLLYYKAYKKNWFGFMNKKIAIAFWFVIILTLINLFTNTLVLCLVDYYIADKDFEKVIMRSIKLFSFLPIAMLPAIYLHSFLVYSMNSYVSFALALIISIIAIPLVNLLDFYYVPYSNGLILLKKEPPYFFMSIWGIFVILVSIFGSNFILKK